MTERPRKTLSVQPGTRAAKADVRPSARAGATSLPLATTVFSGTAQPSNTRQAPGEAARHATTPPVTTPALAAATRTPGSGVRISKLMAERGLCSRRDADAYIGRGWVCAERAARLRASAAVPTRAQ